MPDREDTERSGVATNAATPVRIVTYTVDRSTEILERLDRLERLIIDQRTIKDFYTAPEVAKILGKSRLTVSEWFRLGRVNAAKRASGRSASSEWIISHEELERIRTYGLLPDPATNRGAASLSPSVVRGR
jgi:ParB-like chromosome segregation protein Spo0J